MPDCPNCGGSARVSRGKTSWWCGRPCGARGQLNPNYDPQGQMEAQFPNPELKYQPKKEE